jgi:hypothetical protein
VAWYRERAEAVERAAGAIDHAAEQFVAHRQVLGAVGRAAARLDALAGDQGGWVGSTGSTWAPGARPKTSSVGIMKSFSP